MLSRCALLTESSVAMRTSKWFQSVVDSLVFLECRQSMECFGTMWTLKIANHQMVPFNVRIESRLTRIACSVWSFGTLHANKSSFDTMDVVHVTPIMDKSVEDFPANFAFDAQLILMRFPVRVHFVFFEKRLSAFWTRVGHTNPVVTI